MFSYEPLNPQFLIFSQTFDDVTILFGLIQDFAAICIKVDAMTVVQLVSEVFSLFDILSESHKVYKVNIFLFIQSISFLIQTPFRYSKYLTKSVNAKSATVY